MPDATGFADETNSSPSLQQSTHDLIDAAEAGAIIRCSTLGQAHPRRPRRNLARQPLAIPAERSRELRPGTETQMSSANNKPADSAANSRAILAGIAAKQQQKRQQDTQAPAAHDPAAVALLEQQIKDAQASGNPSLSIALKQGVK
ncbi:MAG: hypothetical protein WBZ37_26045 [Mycobacterium sp.]